MTNRKKIKGQEKKKLKRKFSLYLFICDREIDTIEVSKSYVYCNINFFFKSLSKRHQFTQTWLKAQRDPGHRQQ